MEKGIREFIKEFGKEKDFIFNEANKRAKNSLVRLTPVLEGQAVSEWDAAVNADPVDTKPPFDPRKTKTRKRLQGIIDKVKFGDYVIYDNDDPASIPLEFGYSKKAPQGMVRLTARKWRGFVRGAGRAALNKAKKRVFTE